MRAAVGYLIAGCVVVAIAVLVTCFYIVKWQLNWYNRFEAHARRPKVGVSDAYEDLRTGDVLYSIAYIRHPAISAASDSLYSHVGVIVRSEDFPEGSPFRTEPPTVYYAESTRRAAYAPDPARPGSDLRLPDGVTLSPLLSRMSTFQGSWFLSAVRPDPSAAQVASIVERVAATQGTPYPRTGPLLLESLTGLAVSRDFHCFEYAAYLLEGAGLISGVSQSGVNASVRLLCELSSWSPRYEEPVQLVYDLGWGGMPPRGGPRR